MPHVSRLKKIFDSIVRFFLDPGIDGFAGSLGIFREIQNAGVAAVIFLKQPQIGETQFFAFTEP